MDELKRQLRLFKNELRIVNITTKRAFFGKKHFTGRIRSFGDEIVVLGICNNYLAVSIKLTDIDNVYCV